MKEAKKERNLKLTEGKWYVDFTFHGRRIRQFGGYTKAQARNTLAKLRTEKMNEPQGFKKLGTALFKTFAENYITNQSKVRPKTREAHETCLRAILRSELFRGKRLSEITTETIDKYKVERGAERLVSANRELTFIKQVFRRAVDWGEVVRNPAATVEKFREPQNRLRVLTDEEASRLLEAAGPRLRAFLCVLMTTAMRPHEAFNLHWPHDGWETEKELKVSIASLEKRVIFIPKDLAKNHRDRTIPMSPELAALFESLPRLTGDKVFPWVQTPRCFREAVIRAKLRDVTLYTMKHTAASRMIRAGIDIATVSELIGHSDPKMTLRYCHSSLETKQEAVGKLSRIYLQAAQPSGAGEPPAMDELSVIGESIN